MVRESELSFRQYSLTVSKWLMYLESGNFNIYIEPIFHQKVSECLFGKYPTEKITLIGNKAQTAIFGESVLETILYIANNNMITSELFPEISGKRLSELEGNYQRYFKEYKLDLVHFYGEEKYLEYFGNLHGCGR